MSDKPKPVSIRFDVETLAAVDALGARIADEAPQLVSRGSGRYPALLACIRAGLARLQHAPIADVVDARGLPLDALVPRPRPDDSAAALALTARVLEAVDAYHAATGPAPTDELQVDAASGVRVEPVPATEDVDEPETPETADVAGDSMRLALHHPSGEIIEDRRSADADAGPGGERRRWEDTIADLRTYVGRGKLMSQKRAAELIGISPATLSRWLNGKSRPQEDTEAASADRLLTSLRGRAGADA